jgi:hypothetical protein
MLFNGVRRLAAEWAMGAMRSGHVGGVAGFLTVMILADAAFASEAAVTCTNPASGAQWQITIDYDKATVDANPAHIGTTEISWHDAKDGGNYTLDRSSGKLTVVIASSTGGYFLYDQCQLKN